MDTDKSQLSSKNDNLEKKVESLVKFLEGERRLRYELEDKLKRQESSDSD